MTFHADLHIHSRYSRATSRESTPERLAWWARRKGIGVLGTGDFTHPAWRQELSDKLVPAEPGLLRLRPDLETTSASPGAGPPVRFMLTSEVATIYKKNGAVRKIHHVLAAPNFAAVDHIRTRLDKIGNLNADGRPILGLDSRNLLEIVLEAGPDCFLIPAHIWTPWFALFGSRSGFDSVEACYDDLSPHIFALETGLSSDPAMNRRLSQLDRYRLVSNSDAHSPSRLGRETTVFHTPLDYFAMLAALRTGEGFGGTVEFFPEEGKYHQDGHRECGVRWEPQETRTARGLCPVCGKGVTVGVLSRVEELADRAPGVMPPTAAPYASFIPLAEVLGELVGQGPATRKVQTLYDTLIAQLGPELTILGETPLDALARHGGERLAAGIQNMRQGRVFRQPGYDGEYGVIKLFSAP